MVVPLLMGIVMYLITRNAFSIVFMLMMPLMMAGTYYEARRQQKDYAQAMADFREDLEPALPAHPRVARGRGRHPARRAPQRRRLPRPPSATASALLWTAPPRRQRLRRAPARPGHAPSRSTIKMPAVGRSKAEAWLAVSRSCRVSRSSATSRSSPTPAPTGAIGIAGPRASASTRLAPSCSRRSPLHSPGRPRRLLLRLRRLRPRLGLPQVAPAHDARRTAPSTSTTSLRALPPARRSPTRSRTSSRPRAPREEQEQAQRPSVPTVLVLVESDAPIDRSRLVALAERGHRHGIVVVWVAETQTLLPAACHTFLVVSDDQPGRSPASCTPARQSCSPSTSTASATTRPWRAAPPARAARRRRACRSRTRATCRDPCRSSPSSGTSSPRRRGRGHRASGARTALDPHRSVCAGRSLPPQAGQPARHRRPVGRGHLLRRPPRADGPHALVGGTTGAGKSELLQAWILGMAVAHSPQRRDLPARRLQGWLGVPRLRQPAAHRRARDRPLAAPRAPCARVALGRAASTASTSWPSTRPRTSIELERRGEVAAPPSLVIVVDEFAALVAGGARVRRRRRQRRPARSLARPAPHPRDAASGRCHQGQPARQHQPADGAADGRRERLRRRARHAGRPPTSTPPCPVAPSPRPVPDGSSPSRPGMPVGGPPARRRPPR